VYNHPTWLASGFALDIPVRVRIQDSGFKIQDPEAEGSNP
jgi:hypothetical protein